MPDLGIQIVTLVLEIFAIRLLLFGDMHRIDVEVLGDLLDSLGALDCFKRQAGLEFGFISSSLCFHCMGLILGLDPAPGKGLWTEIVLNFE